MWSNCVKTAMSIFTWISLSISVAIGAVAIFALLNYRSWSCQGEANNYIVFSSVLLILSSLMGLAVGLAELSRPGITSSSGSVVCDGAGCKVSGFVPRSDLRGAY